MIKGDWYVLCPWCGGTIPFNENSSTKVCPDRDCGKVVSKAEVNDQIRRQRRAARMKLSRERNVAHRNKPKWKGVGWPDDPKTW